VRRGSDAVWRRRTRRTRRRRRTRTRRVQVRPARTAPQEQVRAQVVRGGGGAGGAAAVTTTTAPPASSYPLRRPGSDGRARGLERRAAVGSAERVRAAVAGARRPRRRERVPYVQDLVGLLALTPGGCQTGYTWIPTTILAGISFFLFSNVRRSTKEGAYKVNFHRRRRRKAIPRTYL
jgi:HAMP domain-containing protein